MKNWNLIQRIRNKFNYWRHKIFVVYSRILLDIQIRHVKKESSYIYVFGVPIHSNLGDQAQLLCIERWIKEYFPSYKAINICARTMPSNCLKRIYGKIKKDDYVFIHSGYLFMNKVTDVPLILDVVNMFKGNKIILFPQTVNFPDEQTKKKFISVFAEHPQLTLLCRDFVSYEKAKDLFPHNRCVAYPDIVTSLIGTYDENYKREGICFCLRDDAEKLYTEEELEGLISRFKSYNCNRIDTTIKISPFSWLTCRKHIIYKMINEIARHRLVITDRYHGTIFSIIANTPVIIINSSDHKLSSGMKWFEQDCFKRSVFYAENLEEAFLLATNVLNDRSDKIKNPPHLLEKYWKKLHHII